VVGENRAFVLALQRDFERHQTSKVLESLLAPCSDYRREPFSTIQHYWQRLWKSFSVR
jgi:hypothetical protein